MKTKQHVKIKGKAVVFIFALLKSSAFMLRMKAEEYILLLQSSLNLKKLQLFKLEKFIDWANVYGWKSSLPQTVDPKKLIKYLKKQTNIEEINLYYGEDTNNKSQQFLKEMQKIGYIVTSKPVKYITVGQVGGTVITKRKCDFDIEICMSVYNHIAKGVESFIFFSGDGDFEPLYKHLIALKKQVIVIYERGHLGNVYLGIQKIIPPISRGA